MGKGRHLGRLVGFFDMTERNRGRQATASKEGTVKLRGGWMSEGPKRRVLPTIARA